MKKPLQPRQTDDKLTVDYDREDFEGALPNLAKELLGKTSESRLSINALSHDVNDDEDDDDYNEIENLDADLHTESNEDFDHEHITDNFDESTQNESNNEKHLYDKVREREEYIQAQGENLPDKELYNPGAVDFLRRCNTIEEAHEILNYLENRQEITSQEKSELLLKIEKEGLRSFGSKKSWGYYERKYRKNLPNMEETLE
jgi:hypothetical protein